MGNYTGPAGVSPQEYFLLNNRDQRSISADISITALHLPEDANSTIAFTGAQQLIITQNFTPKWTEQQAYGKMDPIATFSHTNRKLKIDFMIIGSPATADGMAAAVERLVQFSYPSYVTTKTKQTLQAPPFLEISVMAGKYIPKLQGYMTNIDIRPGTSKQFQALKGKDTWREMAYHIVCDFRVLHSEPMGWTEGQFTTAKDGHVYHAAERGKSRQTGTALGTPTPANPNGPKADPPSTTPTAGKRFEGT